MDLLVKFLNAGRIHPSFLYSVSYVRQSTELVHVHEVSLAVLMRRALLLELRSPA